MKALPDDAEFNKRSSKFVLLQVDTKNGRSKPCARLGLNRNRTYFLVLDARGNEIARIFGPGGRKRHWPQLLLMMDDALATRKGMPLLKRLTQLLRHPSHDYRADAVDAIGKQGAKAANAVPALLPLLADRSGSPPVSWWTTIALKSIGASAKAAIPLLQKLIEDKTRPDNEKQMALSALGRLDPKGEKVLPTLRKALKGNRALYVGALLAVTDLGKAAAPLVPDLEAAASRYGEGKSGYIRKLIAAIQAKR